MKLKKKVVLIILLHFGVHAFSQNKITINVDAFKELKVFDGISVNLIRSNENKAVITGENIQKVAVVGKGEILKIRMEIDKIFSGFRTFVDLYHTDDVIIIDVNEDALISSQEVMVRDLLELKAQEGGQIQLPCQTEQLLVKAVTGGDVITRGFTDIQDIKINTGGSYEGMEFKSSFTTIAVNAGGNAKIYATKYVKADIRAGGRVQVYGDPEKMDEKTILGGKIERVD